MQPGLETFVGMKPISQQHAMTVGEIASLFNEEFVPSDAGGRKAELTVVPMPGWRRCMYYDETGLPWVMPSPNMPTPDTALIYYGRCLFEGTNCRRAAAPPGRSSWSPCPTSTTSGRTDCGSFDAITTAVAMPVTAKRLYPGSFGWQYPGRDPPWVNKLSGSSWIRTSVDARKSTQEIVAGRQQDLAAFARLREHYLLYR